MAKFNSISLQFVIAWSIVGFPLIAGVTSIAGIDNSTVSLGFRALAALAATALIIIPSSQPIDKLLSIFVFFWVTYLAKLFLSLFVFNEPLSRPPSDYLLWAIGACMLPAFATFKATTLEIARDLQAPLLLVAITATLIALVQGGTGFVQETGHVTDINRWNLSSLNPISTGHLGVTTILLGVSLMVSGNCSGRGFVIASCAVFFGAILAVFANSRGPVVALVLCSAVLLVGGRRLGGRIQALIGAGFTAILAYLSLSDFSVLASMMERFSAVESGADLSAIGRMIAFQGAIEQFLSEPVFGDGIEERVTGYYPHNLLLEAYMATGLIGGIPFTLLLLASLAASWHLVRNGGAGVWVGLLTLQYIIAGQFSGSLYLSTAMWVTMPLAIFTCRIQRKLTGADSEKLLRKHNYNSRAIQ